MTCLLWRGLPTWHASRDLDGYPGGSWSQQDFMYPGERTESYFYDAGGALEYVYTSQTDAVPDNAATGTGGNGLGVGDAFVLVANVGNLARGFIGGPSINAAAGPTNAAERSLAAQNIQQARNLLRETGLPLAERNQIIRSFDLQTFRVETVGSEMTALRLFDDSNAVLRGRYVSTDFFASQTDRIQSLALMNNSATRLGEVTIPRGSVAFTGRVAPQRAYSPGLTGGANQTFLMGNLDNYTFREIYMPR